MLTSKQSFLFLLALFSCVLCANDSLAQQDPNDVVSDQLTSNGSAIVVEAFYGAGGVLSSADDANFANTSYLVVDHNDGSAPVAFGYRYNDSANATAETLFIDVLFGTISNPNDEELYAKFSTFNFGGGDSNFVNGIGYNTDGDASFGDLSDGTTSAEFVAADGFLDAPSADPSASSIDTDDSYQEGGGNASWVFFNSADNPYLSGPTPQWGGPANFGITSTPLVDGSFNGFYFDFDFSAVPPELVDAEGAAAFGDLGPGLPETVTVPEPTGLMLLCAAGISLGLRRKRG